MEHFEISRFNHPLVKHLEKLRKNRDYREEQSSCVIVGKKIIDELSLKYKPKRILTSERIIGENVFITTPEILEKITGLKTFKGSIAEFFLPAQSALKEKKWILAIDRITDPGNLGTLIRTAYALNWEGIFFLPNCVDPFNDKTLRSSKGAIFHIPYAYGHLEELKEIASRGCLPIFIADTKGVPINTLTACQKGILVLSHEAQGPKNTILSLGTQICIPMSLNAESLNVATAGGILLYLLRNKKK